MTTSDETSVRRIIREIVGGGGYSLLPDLVSERYVDHTPMGDITGHDESRDFIESFRAPCPASATSSAMSARSATATSCSW